MKKYLIIATEVKEISSAKWLEFTPQRFYPNNTANITGLIPDVPYAVRVILIDEDGNNYQGELVPQTTFRTFCRAPTTNNYQMEVKNINYNSFTLTWKYQLRENDCPPSGYSLILQRRWLQKVYNTSSSNTEWTFYDLLPGSKYTIRMRAITNQGKAPQSTTITVMTQDRAPGNVANLSIASRSHDKISLTWSPPIITGGRLTKYIITYQCEELLGCSESCSSIKGEVTVDAYTHQLTLVDLLPHARYELGIAGISKYRGPYSKIFVSTRNTAPDVTPESAEKPVLVSTNSSLTVQWSPPTRCSHINGYKNGYHWELLSPNNTILLQGNTTKTNITFYNLSPQSLYTIYVYVISSGGTSKQKLTIQARTEATVPGKVQNLFIYKIGRRLLGLRWELPVNTYGEIVNFSVSYCVSDEKCNDERKRNIVSPVHCHAWPHSYCHTISNLSPNRKYFVMVRAQNDQVSDYGDSESVTAVTRESAPEAPMNLKIVEKSTTMISLEWSPPEVLNGILRSFLINVEQIDSANSSNCCVYFPLQEMAVKNEEPIYRFQVRDLSPASKYIVGISSKTISIGPSSIVNINTPPEVPDAILPPKIISNRKIEIPQSTIFPGINSTSLLLIIFDNDNTTSVFWNTEISLQLTKLISGGFYVLDEFNEDDLLSPVEVEMGKGGGTLNGSLGILEDRVLPSKFFVGIALILDYYGAYNIGFVKNNEEIEIKMNN